MTAALSWKTAAKIAWRESRASSAKFLFVILAVAIGVAALTGVRGFSRTFGTMLLREARTLLAADLSVRVFSLPTPQQEEAMRELEGQGIRRTWITETLSMGSITGSGEPALVSVKAVEPGLYPFYGQVKLEPAGDLAEVLDADSVAAGEDLLIRLDARVGDRIDVGGHEYRIVAAITAEPDRMAGSMNVGPRLMMSREGLERSGLIQPGSRAAQRFLFELGPQAPPVQQVRERLKAAFPDALIADFREVHPLVQRGLDRATIFLSLVSLVALIVGSLGVAMAMRAHLQQKLDSIAIMKCIGGRSGQIVRIYLIQTLGLGLAGGLLGVAGGVAVQAVFPLLLERYFAIRPEMIWEPISALQGLATGILTTLLFTLPTLLSVRQVRPGLIFRREMAEQRKSWRQRWLDSRAAIVTRLFLVAGIGLVAAWLSHSWQLGLTFLVGLLVSLAFLSGIAWLLLRGLQRFLRWSPWRLPVTMRHGMANLYRPGNHAQAVLVALGIGVMFTTTVFLVQRSFLTQMMRSAPPDMPNVFLINITPHEAEPIQKLLDSQPGVEGGFRLVPSVQGRLRAINGKPIEEMEFHGWQRRFLRERQMTWSAALPEHTRVVRGDWWQGVPAEPQVSLTEEAADILRIGPGAVLEWNVTGLPVRATVAAVHRTEAVRPGASVEFVLSPGALEGAPTIYYGGIRVQPAAVPQLQRTAFRQFPSVTVINIADVLHIVQDVVDQVSLVIRFVSAFAIAGGIIVLAASVAGSRFRRIREVVILKTLGATRSRLAGIFSVEFLILGSVAGLIGAGLATGFAGILLRRMFEADYRPEAIPILIAMAATALLANMAGWLASFRILGQKPLEILRDE